MELTDEQVLDHLTKKKGRLQKELHKLEVAIDALSPEQLNESENNVKSVVIKKVTTQNDNIDISESVVSKISELTRNEKIIDEYNFEFKVLDQLHFALKYLDSSTVLDISDFIYELDNRVPKDKLHRRFTDIASSEYRAGRLNADKSRRQYLYSLIKKDNNEPQEDQQQLELEKMMQ